jgi:hypothetical protein
LNIYTRQFKKNLRNTRKRRKKNWQAINDETKKTSSDFPWWNNSIDNIHLESIEEFKNSLEKLKLNSVLNLDAKKCPIIAIIIYIIMDFFARPTNFTKYLCLLFK